VCDTLFGDAFAGLRISCGTFSSAPTLPGEPGCVFSSPLKSSGSITRDSSSESLSKSSARTQLSNESLFLVGKDVSIVSYFSILSFFLCKYSLKLRSLQICLSVFLLLLIIGPVKQYPHC